ncbi:uncharacterized protein KQ657_004310 [Scheffersomyces spartinae]|uniref:Uncharacterized protein n=1 Tax=Scheffersomyces spartinae TaxID=45513 RepID=A0A9P7VC67_9ASCO|nr:uncharacterized protein KQ657_004310 [Scheffersomyces spartinae]KAG7194634.1 hypothetical protein KQ657_004310 [Scheffersomyces spartinae]
MINLNALILLTHEDFIEGTAKYLEDKDTLNSHSKQYYDSKVSEPLKYLDEALITQKSASDDH